MHFVEFRPVTLVDLSPTKRVILVLRHLQTLVLQQCWNKSRKTSGMSHTTLLWNQSNKTGGALDPKIWWNLICVYGLKKSAHPKKPSFLIDRLEFTIVIIYKLPEDQTKILRRF
jgi:hypothetical protein